MIRLDQMSATELTETEIGWLIRSCLAGFDGVTVQDIIRAALAGEAGIYKISGDAQGIVVLESCRFGVKPGMKILAVAGKGLIRHMSDLNEQVRIAVRACGGEFIWGLAGSTGLGRVYQRRANARKAAEVWIEDLT